ncbi:hypothetical protein CAMRE0001_2756 [Campylobacter rectus RM3267]|uniref:Uncharacterized protein n=1 Tax=Campylobacter rectus RM3267 TaxID=553218 RepID=B9D0V6_CAMRE|nr:hypothetical protein CAMRE0001_2756 [Campylobacter rectus RM3267]
MTSFVKFMRFLLCKSPKSFIAATPLKAPFYHMVFPYLNFCL